MKINPCSKIAEKSGKQEKRIEKRVGI